MRQKLLHFCLNYIPVFDKQMNEIVRLFSFAQLPDRTYFQPLQIFRRVINKLQFGGWFYIQFFNQ